MAPHGEYQRRVDHYFDNLIVANQLCALSNLFSGKGKSKVKLKDILPVPEMAKEPIEETPEMQVQREELRQQIAEAKKRRRKKGG